MSSPAYRSGSVDAGLHCVGKQDSFEVEDDDKQEIDLNIGRTLEDTVNFDLSDFEDCDVEDDLGDVDICSSGDDVSLIYWYHRLVKPPKSYQEMMDYLTAKNEKSHNCLGQFTGFKAWEHSNGCRLIIPEINTEKYNPADKFQSIRSSASRTAKQLTNLNWIPTANENKKALVNLELTFPKELSDKLKGGFEKEGVISDYWDCLKDFLERFNHKFTTANLHLWKSQQPFKPNAHFHLAMVWAKDVSTSDADKNLLKPKEWDENGKPVDSAKVKSLWAKVLNEHFDTSYCSDYEAYKNGITELNSLLGNNPVVCYSSWKPLSPLHWSVRDSDNSEAEVKKGVIHRLKYCRRKPLTDLGEYYNDNDFNPSDVDDGFLSSLVDYGNSSRQFGKWCRLKSCVNVEDEDEGEDKNLCPVCAEDCDCYSILPDEFEADKRVEIGKRGKVRVDKVDNSDNNESVNLNTQRRDFEDSGNFDDWDGRVEDLEC